MSELVVRPISWNAAKKWLKDTHRHHKRPPGGWLFGARLLDGDRMVAVACAGRPCRMLQDGSTIEITRVATDGTPNACSALYGALRRAAVALGYQRVYTYTRMDEPGSSVRAAGFVDDGPAGGGEWSRGSRPREAVEDDGPKRRWVWPASARRKTEDA